MVSHECHVKTTVANQLEVGLCHLFGETHGKVDFFLCTRSLVVLIILFGDEAGELWLDVLSPVDVVHVDSVDLGYLLLTLF